MEQCADLFENFAIGRSMDHEIYEIVEKAVHGRRWVKHQIKELGIATCEDLRCIEQETLAPDAVYRIRYDIGGDRLSLQGAGNPLRQNPW